MKLVAALRSWAHSAFHRASVEQRMDEELRFHIESYAADLEREGVAPAEAARRARAELGGIEPRKELLRDALGLRLFDELRADARYAYRQLRRAPLFTTVAVMSLALGIGANTAIFSLMEAALWKPNAVHEPDRLGMFSWVSGPRAINNSSWGSWNRTPAGGHASTSFSYPVYEALRNESAHFDTIFAFKPLGRVTAIVGGEAELVAASLVSGDFYNGIGVAPAIGRAIDRNDDARGATETVAAISDGFWARRFGRNPSVIGTTIRVNQAAVTIVGVNPPEFTGLEPGERPDLFMPISTQPLVYPFRHAQTGSLLDDPDYWWVLIMGRLKPGVTAAQAQGTIDVALQRAVKTTLPDRTDRDQPHFRLLPGARGQDNLREAFATPLVALGALVAVVLLIACANVANLLLARAVARRRELSLRLALGAGRWRVTRQLLTEGLVLGVTGGAIGVVLAYWTRRAIPDLLLPAWAAGAAEWNPEFDVRVLVLTIGVTIATTLLFSIAPIWQSVRIEINAALKDGGRAVANARSVLRGKWIVVSQVALAVLLLVGAGLFIRTLSNLRAVSLGFKPERIILFTMDPPRPRYTGSARKALFERLDDAFGAIPGIEAASLSESALLAGGSSTTRVGPNGRPSTSKDSAWVNDVGRHFFEVMGIPIVAGRAFNDGDRETSPPVVVVNQRFVKQFFPNESAVGRTIRNNNKLYEIVGIAGDTPFGRLREPVPPTFYRLFSQGPERGGMHFELRSSATQSQIMNAVRAAVRGIDKDLPVFDVRTQMEQIDGVLSQERLFVTLTTTFGVLAALLASIGIYGLLAHGVSRRTNEIGIRLALGAERRWVQLMILREASWLAVLGAAIGAIGAVALSRYVRAMLFNVAPSDPAMIAGAVALMLLVALIAGWLPARRASRMDPMTALRHE